jgi:hypothetical protein
VRQSGRDHRASQPTSVVAAQRFRVGPWRRSAEHGGPNASAARVVERSKPYCRPAGVSALGSAALAWLRRACCSGRRRPKRHRGAAAPRIQHGQPFDPAVQTRQMTTPFDYDRNPERFRLGTRVTRQYLTAPRSLHDHLAEPLVAIEPRRILDIGCGEGALRAALPPRLRPRVVGLDASATMLAAHPPPVVQADAVALPFAADVFDAAVAVNVLDHRPSPSARPTVSLPREDPSSPPRPAATTRQSWQRSGSRHPPASTPRTRPGWWRRCSGRCRSSGGTGRW